MSGESSGSEWRRCCSAISISPSDDRVLAIFRGIEPTCRPDVLLLLVVVISTELGDVFRLPARKGSLEVAVVGGVWVVVESSGVVVGGGEGT